MKIMQLISSSGFYGAEKVLLDLSQGLMESGHGVVVTGILRPQTPGAALLEKARSLQIPAVGIVCRRRIDLPAIAALRRCTAAHDIGIIHSHGYKSNLYALLARPSPGIRLVTTCHNWPGTGFKMSSYHLLDKVLLKKFDRVVLVSDDVRKKLRGVKLAPGSIVTIHNGVRCGGEATLRDRAALRRELGIGQQEPVVTAVGRLAPEKGLDFLVAAAPAVLAGIPGTRFVIVGDGPERSALVARVAREGHRERILLLGKRDDVQRILCASDVFVMPSLDEGMPMALLEAMACGKAVVASRVGGVPRMIDSGIEGILVTPGSSTGLANALIELLSNPRKAERMGNSARRRVRREFSFERMLQSYVKVYGELGGGKGSRE